MKKILIVEDKAQIRKLVQVTLRTGEYEISEAENGSFGIQQARILKPDLILMDVMMPGDIDGLEATRIIKQDPDAGQCPVVLLTAKGQQDDIDAGLKAGADDYIVKPFSPLELIRKIEDLLE